MPDPTLKLPPGATLLNSGSMSLPAGATLVPDLSGPNDPSGTYDFGDVGKISGAKVNGRPATRAEAFDILAKQRGIGQELGQNIQRKRQDISNFVQSATDTDQQIKQFMGDLAQMGVVGGAANLGSAWRSGLGEGSAAISQGYRPTGDVADLVKRSILGNTVGRVPGASLLGESFERPTLKEVLDVLKPNPQGTLFNAASKLGAPAPFRAQASQARTTLSQLDAALQREAPTAYESDVDMITRRAPPREGFTGEQSKVGFGTAPGNIPIEERMTPPEGAYAKTPPRSNLSKNQRQLAARQAQAPAQPTVKASTDFPQEIQDILNRPASSYQPQDYDTLHDFFARQGKYSAPTQKPAGFTDTADALKTLKLPEPPKASVQKK